MICKKLSNKIGKKSIKNLKIKSFKENSTKNLSMISESKLVNWNSEWPWWPNNTNKNSTVWAHKSKWLPWLLSDKQLKSKNIPNNPKSKKDIFNKLLPPKIRRLKNLIIRSHWLKSHIPNKLSKKYKQLQFYKKRHPNLTKK